MESPFRKQTKIRSFALGFHLSSWWEKWRQYFDELHGVYGDPIDFHTPVKMRSTDSAGGAGQSKVLSFFNMLAGTHVNSAQMGINCKNSGSMVDDDSVAGIKEVFGQFDDPRIGGKNRFWGSGTKIDAIVKAFQLSVEDPFITKGAGDIT